MSAMELLFEGWGVFPLPLGAKGPPPKGVTGSTGTIEIIEEEDIVTHTGNFGLRLDGMVGIDVDAYKVSGQVSFRVLQGRTELPPTLAISSGSGGFTLLYRIEEKGRLVSSLGEGIDIIQKAHRYTVCPPSIHPSGKQYEWHWWDGERLSEPLTWTPSIDDVALAPKALESLLRARQTNTVTPLSHNELKPLEGSTEACRLMRSVLAKAKQSMLSGTSSRHDLMTSSVWAVVSIAGKGHGGLDFSLNVLRDVFMSLFSDGEKGTRNVIKEFESAVETALIKVARSGSCNCGKQARKPFTRKLKY